MSICLTRYTRVSRSGSLTRANGIGHDDVSVDAEAEVAAHALQGVFKDSSARVDRERGIAVTTAEGYKMGLADVVITRKAPRHELSVDC
jgi:hypothetical protein